MTLPSRRLYFGLLETGSTNEDAKRYLAAMAGASTPNATVVFCALRQNQGRGKGGRAWLPSVSFGSAAVTLLVPEPLLFLRHCGAEVPDEFSSLRPPPPQADAFAVILAALALYDVTAQFLCAESKKNLRVKWPNDILLNGRKVAGILTEKIPAGTQANPWPCDVYVIGCGWNLSCAPLIEGAGSVKDDAGPAVSLPYGASAGRVLAQALEIRSLDCAARGRKALCDEWLGRSLGRDGGVAYAGLACRVTGLGEDGALWLRGEKEDYRVTDPDFMDWSLAREFEHRG